MSGLTPHDATPRQSISSEQHTPPSGPLPLFDFHIRILTDSYLNFFQERKKIEETYVDSLMRLHRKTKSIDEYLDHSTEGSTTRSAWNEVRENVEREAQTRQAFLATLSGEVISPLNGVKERHDRSRKYLKESIKESSLAYQDHVENVLPKAKRIYLRKCQDVEDYKAAASAPQPTSPTQLEHHGHPLSNVKSNPTKPVVTSPQPLRPLERRPSAGASQRARSPSTNTSFADLAQQGKKQLNSVIAFLDKSGTVKETLGGRNENSSLRAVRAKREADEADKLYRKAVHHNETLRIRQSKILENGYKSLEMFIHESAATLKVALEKYTDNMTATTTTETQLSSHARQSVNRISPDKDAGTFAMRIPRSLAAAVPRPVMYYNYTVGECNDLIFGVGLVDYATSKSLPDGIAPRIIRMCINEVDAHGLACEGIYRVSGRYANVQELQHKIERNEEAFRFNPVTDDVYAVSSLLKLYLRELPEPVFKYPLHDRLQHTEDREEHLANNFTLLRSKMRRLPQVHQATLKAILEHLARVIANRETNKMDAKNLAIVFGGVIFGEDDLPKAGDLLSHQSMKDSLMEDLIVNAGVLFDDNAVAAVSPPRVVTPVREVHREQSQHQPLQSQALLQQSQQSQQPSPPPPQQQQLQQKIYQGPPQPVPVTPPPLPQRPNSPPLPAFPEGVDPAVVTYGSGYTKVSTSTVPFPEPAAAASQDFTPQLPARPMKSIHPSSTRGDPSHNNSMPPPPLPASIKAHDEQAEAPVAPRPLTPPDAQQGP